MATGSEIVAARRALRERLAMGRLVNGERLWRALIWVLLLAGACVMILPFLWLVTSSLKTDLEVFRYPPKWIPYPPQFQNYIDAWTTAPLRHPGFGVYLKNTLFVVILNEIGILGSTSLVAYALARIDFPGKKFWFILVHSPRRTSSRLPGVGRSSSFSCGSSSSACPRNWPMRHASMVAASLASTGASCCPWPSLHWRQ